MLYFIERQRKGGKSSAHYQTRNNCIKHTLYFIGHQRNGPRNYSRSTLDRTPNNRTIILRTLSDTKERGKMFGTLSDTKELYKTHFILYWIPKKWTQKLLQVHAWSDTKQPHDYTPYVIGHQRTLIKHVLLSVSYTKGPASTPLLKTRSTLSNTDQVR